MPLPAPRKGRAARYEMKRAILKLAQVAVASAIYAAILWYSISTAEEIGGPIDGPVEYGIIAGISLGVAYGVTVAVGVPRVP